jgi:endoglucanase
MMTTRSSPVRLFLLLLVGVVALAMVAGAEARTKPAHASHRAHHAGGHTHRHRGDKRHRERRGGDHKRLPKKVAVPAGVGTVSTPAGGTSTTPGGSTSSTPGGGTSTTTAGERFYVYPHDSAVTEENTLLAQGNSSDAAQIEKIASQPEGIWLYSDSTASIVPGIMSAAAGSGTVPVFVVYDIPGRDCGGYSSGGASGASDYETFINSVVAGLGRGKAVVVVEPDALTYLAAGCDTMGGDGALIDYAAQQLDTDPNAAVYVDAGNPGWESAAAEAKQLNQVLGSTRAGFAVNVSNFFSTATDVAYGTAISQATGGRHFVVDTSRNGGSVASGVWCNPAGAGIGVDPTTNTGNPLVDAFLWIKDVGESDGTCNGGPSAGQFSLSLALSLVANG